MITALVLVPIVAILGGGWVSADTGFVAFTAVQDTHLNLSHTDTIPYTKVVTNQHANLSSGIFTCESAGIYKFQVYALTKRSATLFFELFHNAELVASIWARTRNESADGGNAAILDLNVGDTVQVKTRFEYEVVTFGTSDQIYTTFTGIKLGTSTDTSESSVTAFDVTVSSWQAVTGGTPVVYDTTVLDTDNAYDVSSGTYTVPSAGIYVLQFFSTARYNSTLWQELYHNGDYVCSLYGKTTKEYADAGNTAIIRLRAGDQLQVRAHSTQLNRLEGHADEMYSTFSGYQLIPESKIDSNEGVPSVYFSAGLSHSVTYQTGEKVVFDRIFSDHGTEGASHYSHLTGEFIAPYSGYYEFNMHALAQSKQAVWLDLYHNYKYIDSLYTHVPDGYGAAGNAAVMEMDAGDVVYIRAHGTSALYGTGSEVYCTFSGTLLAQRGGDTSIVGK